MTNNKNENKVTFLVLRDIFLQDPDLKKFKGYTARVLWALIDFYDKLKGKPGCWASNQTLRTFLGVSEETLRANLRVLEKLGKIYKEGEGNNRVYYSNFDLNTEKPKLNGLDTEELGTEELASGTEELASGTEELASGTDNPGLYNNKRKEYNIKEKEKDILSSDKTSEVTSSKIKILGEESEPYLIASYLRALVLKKYPKYDFTRCQNKIYLKNKLQKCARSIDLMIRIDKRPPAEIIEVIEWAQNDEFWCKNILSADKLRIQYDRLLIAMLPKNGSKEKQIVLIHDPRPDITEKIEGQYRRFMGGNYVASTADRNNFIETTKIMLEKLGPKPPADHVDALLDDIVLTLREVYSNKGGVVYPKMFCSDHTWNKLLPQILTNMGCPMQMAYAYDSQSLKEFDGVVAEEEQLTKDIKRNMGRQNPESPKSVGDDDCPELDYINNVE